MAHPFPHHYETRLEWQKERESWLKATSQPPILGGPPPHFDGNERYWSPEELLLSALELCLNTTFLAMAAKWPWKVQSYTSRTQATLEKTKEGIRFTRILVTVKMRADDQKAAEEVLLKAKKYCIVSNALAAPVELELE